MEVEELPATIAKVLDECGGRGRRTQPMPTYIEGLDALESGLRKLTSNERLMRAWILLRITETSTGYGPIAVLARFADTDPA